MEQDRKYEELYKMLRSMELNFRTMVKMQTEMQSTVDVLKDRLVRYSNDLLVNKK
jgi:hypothetical protein